MSSECSSLFRTLQSQGYTEIYQLGRRLKDELLWDSLLAPEYLIENYIYELLLSNLAIGPESPEILHLACVIHKRNRGAEFLYT